jgi:hypothetical protein
LYGGDLIGETNDEDNGKGVGPINLVLVKLFPFTLEFSTINEYDGFPFFDSEESMYDFAEVEIECCGTL